MVFDSCCDKSLWLMLAVDKKNREDIINFIKIIPKGMYDYICQQILDNNIAFISEFGKNITFEPKIMLGTDGFVYELNGAILHGILKIKMHRYTVGMAIDERFELCLRALYSSDFSSNLQHRGINIGSFSYDGKTTDLFGYEDKHIFYKRKYGIRKTHFDTLVVYPLNCKFMGKQFSLNDMPNEMYLEDLSSNDRVNNLVKSRKRVVNRKV